MKELYLNNQLCDLNQSDPIQYNFQVNDIGDVESRQTTFTNTISLPRTKNNTMILEGLGLVGDTSTLPYQKINASLFEDTIPVIYNGWAVISSTDGSYNLNLYSGIVDLFKAIENKTIGADLNLSETTHNKEIINVINSFTNEYYRYIIADYNGKSNVVYGNNDYVNIDYLVPSIRCKYLIDKIQEKFGFKFIGSVFSNPKYLNWWMTYPKPSPRIENTEEIEPLYVATASGSNVPTDIITSRSLVNVYFPERNPPSLFLDEKTFLVPENGTYRLEIKGEGYVKYEVEDQRTGELSWDYQPVFLDIFINDVKPLNSQYAKLDYRGPSNPPKDLTTRTILFSAFKGQRITFNYEYIDTDGVITSRFNELKIYNIEIKYFQISAGTIIFEDALIDFGIKDFFKEFLWQFGLTTIPLADNKVLFLTTDERINADVINWSDKYNGRINEEYIYGSYAQRNVFKHKYNDENASHNNGFINVYNNNLEDEKDVIQSKVYTPEKNKTTLRVNSNQEMSSNTYMIWQKEVQEKNDKNGNSTTEIKYKDLSNRYYFIRSRENSNQINLFSESLSDFRISEGFSQEDYSDLSFSEIVKNEYLSLDSLINNSRKHFIKLKNLTPVDIQNLRFDVVYYFEQEQQYYILNKLPYQNAKENIGEFIRVIR